MEQMKHFSYGSELTYHGLYEGDDHPVYCHACCEVISGPAYIHDNTSNDDYLSNWLNDALPLYGLHKSCAELPREIQYPLHPHHPLTLSCRRGQEFRGELTYAADGFVCEGCRHYSWGFSYSCDDCLFKLDVRCAPKLESQPLQMGERIERDTDFHNHKLEMFYYDTLLPTPFFNDIVCCNCQDGFHHSAYACIKCRLFIHESCLDKIPKQVPSPFHLQHPLLLRQPSILKRCRACGGSIDGLMLSCQWCSESSDYEYNFHISCCAHTSPSFKLKYDNQHPMFYIKQGYSFGCSSKCVVCNTSCDHCSIYRCVECDVSVHIECIPLPRVVKHECDPDHFLTLSDSLLLKIPSKEYRCDICEKEADIRHHVYYCEDCLYIAHVECVLSEEDPPLEILEYLVSRSRNESERESFGAVEESSVEFDKIIANINKQMDKLAKKETEDESEQESFEAEQKWKNDLEDCSFAEINKIITNIKKKMDKLASKLEVVQEIRAQKLNSPF